MVSADLLFLQLFEPEVHRPDLLPHQLGRLLIRRHLQSRFQPKHASMLSNRQLVLNSHHGTLRGLIGLITDISMHTHIYLLDITSDRPTLSRSACSLRRVRSSCSCSASARWVLSRAWALASLCSTVLLRAARSR